MDMHLDELLVSRIQHLPSRARAVLLAAHVTTMSDSPRGTFHCNTTRRHLSQATGLSSSTISRAIRDIRRSHTPGITVDYLSTPDGGSQGLSITVGED